MKAFLLAGGRGERLRPLTLSLPKCLAPIAGTPLLGIWLDHLRQHGVREVLVNVSHHAELVRGFLESAPRVPAVRLVEEPAPRGSGGTLLAERDFVAGEPDFWVLHADNLTTVDLRAMLAAHRRHRGAVTMGLFHAPEPGAAGIVDLEAGGRIIGFDEKPAYPRSDLASAGVFVARQELFDHIPRRAGVVDLGHDVWPRLTGHMYGHVITEFLMDIGTPAALSHANEVWGSVGAGRAPA